MFLQNHQKMIAFLFLVSSSKSWAFSPSFIPPSSSSSSLSSSTIKIHHNMITRSMNSNNDDEDDFYSDYDPTKYESWNQQSSYTYYDDKKNNNNNFRSFNNNERKNKNFKYTRDISRDNSNIDESVVNDLLAQRGEAKRNRDFDTADAIREDLLLNYAVGIDDRERTWRTGCSSSGSGMRYGGGGGGARGDRRGGKGPRRERNFGPNGHDYEMSTNAGPNASTLSENEIHSMLAERLQAKMSRKFDIADSIQIDLINAGVYVHDGLKEWRADGTPFGDLDGGRGPGRTRGSRNDRNRPYVKSTYSDKLEGATDDTIGKLVMERAKYKALREYEKADLVREGLREKFNVIIDDKLREWSVGGSFGEEHDKLREMAEQFANRGFIKSSSSLPLDNETDEEEIQALVDERTQLKADRNYDEADAIRQDLYERFDVEINDKMKEWSVGGAFSGDKHKQYEKSSGSAPVDKEDEKMIKQALRKRSQLKTRRDYDGADAIRDELRLNFNVMIDDRKKEWRVQGPSRSDYFADDDDYFDDNFDEEMAKFESRLSNESVDEEHMEDNELEDDDDETEYVNDECEESTLLSDGTMDEDDDKSNDEGEKVTEEELLSLTVMQLKEKLRSNNLPVSGKKSELIERLLTAM